MTYIGTLCTHVVLKSKTMLNGCMDYVPHNDKYH